jgi:hypothetical protein
MGMLFVATLVGGEADIDRYLVTIEQFSTFGPALGIECGANAVSYFVNFGYKQGRLGNRNII